MGRGRLLACCLLLAVLTGCAPGEPAAQRTDGEAAIPAERRIAITFDDGPRRETTERLLDGLAERGARATFFLIGKQIEGNEDLVERMQAEGHQIGSHTWNHVRLLGVTEETIRQEVGQTEAALESLLGGEDYWLRPPYGIIDDAGLRWAGSPVVLWSVDPEDWKDQDTGRVVGSVLSHVEDGSIILLHDIYDSSVDAALQIADALSGQGYCFVTVEQLLQAKGIQPQDGTVYRCAK